MKLLSVTLCATGLLFAQNWPVRPANLTIRFEPATELVSGVPIPFKIQITDPRHKPVLQAKVTLGIHRPNETTTKVFKASAIDPGVYMAKPVFPSPGTWDVYVEVRWQDQQGGRTIEYNVPRNVAP